jgi:hypothetical protein
MNQCKVSHTLNDVLCVSKGFFPVTRSYIGTCTQVKIEIDLTLVSIQSHASINVKYPIL